MTDPCGRGKARPSTAYFPGAARTDMFLDTHAPLFYSLPSEMFLTTTH